jgi:hypothetical protein
MLNRATFVHGASRGYKLPLLDLKNSEQKTKLQLGGIFCDPSDPDA